MHETSSTSVATYSEIARLFGVTDKRIGQIEKRALEKLRTAIRREAREAGLSVREWMLGE